MQACGGLALGGSCTLTVDGRVVSGSCRSSSDREAPVCIPSGERPPPGPPREAIEACNRLEPNAGCHFTVRGAATAGTCQKLDGAVVPVRRGPDLLSPAAPPR